MSSPLPSFQHPTPTGSTAGTDVSDVLQETAVSDNTLSLVLGRLLLYALS